MWKIVIQEEHLDFESSLRFYGSYGISQTFKSYTMPHCDGPREIFTKDL